MVKKRKQNESESLEHIAKAIKKDYPDLDTAEIARMIDRAVEDFYDRPIREFVPLFVERRIRAQLRSDEQT